MSKINILVLDAGWVLVGETQSDGNSDISVQNAHSIRVWGSSKGLGEIALGGPTKKTILDKIGTARVMRSRVLFTIPCEDTAWKL